MAPRYFSLRWEGTGDQWWFASPIDWAAANGHYELVRELIQIDGNLLFKLTSLARIRRLEAVWDDDGSSGGSVARCRSRVARRLMEECDALRGNNSLIRAGYGGWLVYTAAAGSDLEFVRELLGRDPLLAFGEGEYGAADVLYAAARGGGEVFRAVLDCCLSAVERRRGEVSPEDFRREVMDRAVHAAARGGNLGILVELLGDGGDVLAYRDSHGSTVLHTAAGRGHVEVVKHLTSSYDIINSVDNRGNTSLHVAAYYGRLPVLEFLISSSPSLISVANVDGDTFLLSAIMGFRAPNFQRLDHHTNLVKKLLDGAILEKLDDIINVRNKDGRTPLHTAIILDIPSEIVELILSVRYIDLNVRDCEGNTPLDLLFARTKTPSSEILIKRIVSAGGVFFSERKSRDSISLVSRPVLMGSPGTSFKIPDAELVENDVEKKGYSKEIEVVISSPHSQSISTDLKKSSSMSGGKARLGNFLRWLGKKEKSTSGSDFGGEDDTLSFKSYTMGSSSRDSPVSLRQQFLRPNSSSLASNKRIMSLQSNGPGPSGNKKKLFGAHDVRQVLPKSNLGSPCSAFSESSWTSPLSVSECSNQSPSLDKMKMKRRLGSFNLRSMNNYFCLGNRSLAIEKSIKSQSQPLPEPEPEPYGLEDQEKSVLL